MVNSWIFSSKNKENIRTAQERLVWGFWDKDLVKGRQSKLSRNWRSFLRLYNNISQGDLAFFQMARTGEIHAIGVVKGKYYDDQTPIWELEFKENKILFPWKVSFHFILYLEDPLVRHFAGIKNYVDGYGIGMIPHHEARSVLNELEKKHNLRINAFF